MGFYINEEITTKLHYKDISLIAVAFGDYQERYSDKDPDEVIKRMRDLVNRLGREMSDSPKNDEPNNH